MRKTNTALLQLSEAAFYSGVSNHSAPPSAGENQMPLIVRVLLTVVALWVFVEMVARHWNDANPVRRYLDGFTFGVVMLCIWWLA